MIVRQFLHTEPAIAASYIVGCGGKSTCVVVDPVDAPEHYLEAAKSLGMDIRYVQLEILHLPGHTPEHIGVLVTDRTRGTQPWLVVTGHTLMVGDMGRTELVADAQSGARALFESARRLKALPDYLPVLPGAFAGSVCGRGLSGNPMSTIGFERRFNRTFGIDDETTFIAAMVRDIPPTPPNATAIRAANLGYPLIER